MCPLTAWWRIGFWECEKLCIEITPFIWSIKNSFTGTHCFTCRFRQPLISSRCGLRHESRRNCRRLFWDTSSRRSFRRHSESRTILLTGDLADDHPGSHSFSIPVAISIIMELIMILIPSVLDVIIEVKGDGN